MNQSTRKSILFDSPATYQICVQGSIDPHWYDLLEGMAVCLTGTEADFPVTTLEGELGDLSALAGVLNTLYELHLPILLVKRLEN